MEAFKPSVLRQQAGEALQNATYPPKKFVLIHTSVALGLTLLITALNFLLNQQIAQTGGLAGMGMRSILSTVQSVLEFAVNAALPFWEIGIVFAALCWVSRQPVTPAGLFQGFHRFGKVLGLFLLQGGIFVVLAIGVVQFSTTLFLFSPMSAKALQIMEPLMEEMDVMSQTIPVLSAEQMAAMSEAVRPLLIMTLVLYLAVALPLFYKLRFTQFSVMDGNSVFAAFVHSFRSTKGHVFHLIRLDLHFWWYYLLQLVGLGLCFGDVILEGIGITLPMSQETGFFLFYVLGVLVQWMLLWQCRGTVTATYAAAYKSFWKRPPTPREQNLP